MCKNSSFQNKEDSIQKVLNTIDKNLDSYVEDLKDAVKNPSISSTCVGIIHAASELVKHFNSIGFSSKLLKTPGHPAVFAEIKGESEKTILIYGHYDVQPVEPVEEWVYPPFSAYQEGEYIYGRGSVDCKGNFYSAIKAVQAFLQSDMLPPLNIKFILDGEEEIGSPSLGWLINEYKDVLKADALLAVDGTTHVDGRSEILIGMKGMLHVEFTAIGPSKDLHSAKAPIVENPAWKLVGALNSIRNSDGKVNIPEFYKDVVEFTEDEIQLLKESNITDEMIKNDIGEDKIKDNLTGFDLQKRLYFEPTCNISTLMSGYLGQGSKSVLPSIAKAKIDFRLVPNQRPDKIFQNLRNYLDENGFGDIKINAESAMPSGKTSYHSKIVKDVISALTKSYGKSPVFKPMMEASGPAYVFTETLGLPWCWIRLGPSENRMHAPNERTTISAYKKGMEAVVHILYEFAGN